MKFLLTANQQTCERFSFGSDVETLKVVTISSAVSLLTKGHQILDITTEILSDGFSLPIIWFTPEPVVKPLLKQKGMDAEELIENEIMWEDIGEQLVNYIKKEVGTGKKLSLE